MSNPCLRIAPLAFMMLTVACAPSRPIFAPPRLSLPVAATTPCRLPTLPDAPTQADLEASYVARGVALIECEGARRLAVDALASQRGPSDP